MAGADVTLKEQLEALHALQVAMREEIAAAQAQAESMIMVLVQSLTALTVAVTEAMDPDGEEDAGPRPSGAGREDFASFQARRRELEAAAPAGQG